MRKDYLDGRSRKKSQNQLRPQSHQVEPSLKGTDIKMPSKYQHLASGLPDN